MQPGINHPNTRKPKPCKCILVQKLGEVFDKWEKCFNYFLHRRKDHMVRAWLSMHASNALQTKTCWYTRIFYSKKLLSSQQRLVLFELFLPKIQKCAFLKILQKYTFLNMLNFQSKFLINKFTNVSVVSCENAFLVKKSNLQNISLVRSLIFSFMSFKNFG